MYPVLKIRFSVLLTVFLACACARHETDEAALHTVSFSDFENVITVDGFVEPVNSTNVTCPQFADAIILSITEDGTFVKEGDVICVLEDADMEGEYDRVVLELNNAKASLAKVRADLTMQYALLSAQVETNKTDTEIARMDSLQFLHATPNQRRIMELQLESAAITEAKLAKKLEALAVIQQSEIRKWEVQINTLTERAASMHERMEALVVKTPKSGLMVRANSWFSGEKVKEGDNVWNNSPIAIIPEMDKMKVKIRTGERDFKQINVNDSVNFVFDAMPRNVASGKITSKMPVGQPVSRGSKVKVFELEASIDSMIELPEPGFTALCHVVPQRIRYIIAVPHIAVFEQDSIKVVYVRGRKGYEMRQVETGPSSLNKIVITEGLDAGELISLAKPKPSLVRKRTLLPKHRIVRDQANDSIFKYIPLWKLNAEYLNPAEEAFLLLPLP